MAKYNMLPSERETHITWSAEDKTAHIFTADPIYIRKLDKMVQQHPDQYKLIKEEDWLGNRCCFYHVPAKYISFRGPITRTLTEDQKAAARERLQKMHAARKQNH